MLIAASLIFIALLLIGALLAVYFIRRHTGSESDATTRALQEFRQDFAALRTSLDRQVIDLSRQVNEQLTQNNTFLQKSYDGYSQAVGKVQHRLGELHQATQSMMEIGKDIASLQQILSAPKLRGGLGEMLLGELLRQILPEDHFSLQYSFRTGDKVDAVIRFGEGLIPVDAKFPLENFKRILEAGGGEAEKQGRKNFTIDVKRHIDNIASKYILPDEGTFEFALMYIPAENVYYETIIRDEMQAESLASYALKKKVVPVSPNSFYAYLQAIARGLKGMHIERSALLILENLGQLETDFKKCMTEFEKVGAHLGHAVSAYDKVSRRMERLQDRLGAVEGRPLQGASSAVLPVSEDEDD